MKTDIYIIISAAVIITVLAGIKLLSSPRSSVTGNRLGASAMLAAVIMVLLYNGIIGIPLVIGALVAGGTIGVFIALKVEMLRMPQMVAMLNGFGGIASLLIAAVVVFDRFDTITSFEFTAAQIAVIIGGITFGGSSVAAAKLDRKMSQRPVVLKGHNYLGAGLLIIMVFCSAAAFFAGTNLFLILLIVSAAAAALLSGVLFSLRIGGADMPVVISLLNSCSGLAASICGFAIGDFMLISIGAVVGAAGLILTKIMCRAMNRSLFEILTGSTLYRSPENRPDSGNEEAEVPDELPELTAKEKLNRAAEILDRAAKVIIVPGYGMALSQAQHRVKELHDLLTEKGKDIRYAIHPVAGRMPGHMNVLLAEVDIPYGKLCEPDDINDDFKNTDAVIIIGACDVVNSAAISVEGTPISGMPILHAHESENVIVCNLDLEPGYSGVENPLYSDPKVMIITGNAADTLESFLSELNTLSSGARVS